MVDEQDLHIAPLDPGDGAFERAADRQDVLVEVKDGVRRVTGESIDGKDRCLSGCVASGSRWRGVTSLNFNHKFCLIKGIQTDMRPLQTHVTCSP